MEFAKLYFQSCIFFIQLFKYSFAYSFAYSFSKKNTAFLYSFIYSFFYSFAYSFFYSFANSPAQLPTKTPHFGLQMTLATQLRSAARHARLWGASHIVRFLGIYYIFMLLLDLCDVWCSNLRVLIG